MFEAYGIRVSSEPEHLAPAESFFFRGLTSSSELSSQLPLLKALIDRLLQEGIEELLQVLGSSKKIKESSERHTSNIITEYTVRTAIRISTIVSQIESSGYSDAHFLPVSTEFSEVRAAVGAGRQRGSQFRRTSA